jgi:hypothetical protein
VSYVLHIAAICSVWFLMSAKNRITVNMTDAEYAALSEPAARFQVSQAWLGRRAMAELLAS